MYKKAGAEEKAAAEYVAAEKAAAEKAVAEKAVAEKVAAVKKVDNKDDEDGEFDLCDDLWDENERSPWKSPATRKTEAAAEKAAAFATGKALQEEAFSWEAFVEVVCTLRKETPTISNKGILTAIKSQYEAWPVGDKEVRDAISPLFSRRREMASRLEKAAAEKAAAKTATAKKAELPEEPTSPAERRQFTPPQSSSWADEKAAVEKAAAEKAAVEKAAAEKAAAEKAAAEKTAAEEAAVEKAAAERAAAAERVAAERVAAEKAAAEKAAAEKEAAKKEAAKKAVAEDAGEHSERDRGRTISDHKEISAATSTSPDIGKEIGKTLSSVFVESPVALFKSITSGKYVEDEIADPDEAAVEGKATAEKAAAEKAVAEKAVAEKAAPAKLVELDLRGARKRIANCEELIARIKAMEPPPPVLEELNHLELVLVSWPPEIREMLIGAEPKKAAAEKAAAEKAADIGKEIGKTLSSVFVESPVALFKSITSGKYVEDEIADPDEAAFVAILEAAEEGTATAEKAAAEKAAAEKAVAEKAAAEKAAAEKPEPPEEPTSPAERVARIVAEATGAARVKATRMVTEATEVAKAEAARLVADAAQAVQQWDIGRLGRNLVGHIDELGKPPPQWAWRWEPGELTVNGNLKDVLDPLISFLEQNGFPIKQDDLFTKWDRHLKTALKSFLNANGAVRDPLDRLGRREPLRTGNGFGTEWNVEAVTALQTFLKNNGADDLEITQRMGLNGDVLFGVCDNDRTIMALQGFLNRQMVQMALD